MNENLFFKPTTQYRKFLILDSIDKNKDITQRKLSKEVGVAVSMINSYLNDYEKEGLIKKSYQSTKTVYYFLTKKGIEKKKVLNIGYLNSSLGVYNKAKKNIIDFLDQIVIKGYRDIILYGAGEVAEILLQTIALNHDFPLNIICVIDDDEDKQGKKIVSNEIVSLDMINNIVHDGILISSYTNNKKIIDKLKAMNYDSKKIIQFFD
ncbi:MAG: winged helix-turn-helix domain-containing protein [Candidatus Izemoplasma sp.]|nr:winged helix-turn-helix domain-containing protein [Candidatus Izemoplasma sp.]